MFNLESIDIWQCMFVIKVGIPTLITSAYLTQVHIWYYGELDKLQRYHNFIEVRFLQNHDKTMWDQRIT
jgi:hypothetical protein